MKSYTDIEQSRKLAEILPLESADMYWLNKHTDLTETKYEAFIVDKSNKHIDFFKSYVAIDKNEIIPCWSLAALLDVLSFPALSYDIEDGEGGWIVSCEKNDKMYFSYYKDSPVDTCYEMILKLHELKML